MNQEGNRRSSQDDLCLQVRPVLLEAAETRSLRSSAGPALQQRAAAADDEINTVFCCFVVAIAQMRGQRLRRPRPLAPWGPLGSLRDPRRRGQSRNSSHNTTRRRALCHRAAALLLREEMQQRKGLVSANRCSSGCSPVVTGGAGWSMNLRHDCFGPAAPHLPQTKEVKESIKEGIAEALTALLFSSV